MSRPPFYNNPELPYHVTSRCINRDWFSLDLDVVWEIMTRHLYFTNLAFNLRIHAFVLMSNHFHLIVRSPDANLSVAMAFFLRETSREITKLSGRINQTYGGRFHRSLLTDPLYYLHAYKYLYRNPVMAGATDRVEEYRYSSLPGLLGERWLDVPISEDEHWGTLDMREETLKWLNTPPREDNLEEVRLALRKSIFKLKPINKRQSDLEENIL